MQRDTTRDKNLLMMGEMPLPPTYIPPESTQAMDATFYYIVGGMTLLAAAFGNIIILNFVSFLIEPTCKQLSPEKFDPRKIG